MMRVLLGGMVFIGHEGPATFTIERDGIRGHGLGGVDMRREQKERPAAHGAFALPGYLTGRSIRWSGLILTRSMAEQDQVLSRLAGLLADGGKSRLVVQGERTLWADVMRASPEPPHILVPGRIASYTFEVWAPDPRMYGETNDFAGGEAAFQRGTFAARPLLVVSGSSASGYTVTGPDDRQVVVTKALTSGAPHTIDMARGGLWIGGERQLRAISVYQPWEIPPGAAGVTATVSNGLSLIQRVTDTYV